MSAVSVCVWAFTCLVGSVSISGPGWKVSFFFFFFFAAATPLPKLYFESQ